MKGRIVLLAVTAAVAVAWTATASAAFLWFAEGIWQVWEPGPFWNSTYFAHGLRWTWAWFSYATKASMRTAYGTTLAYTALGAAAVVGIVAFRVSQLMGYGATGRPAVYGKTEFANPGQMKAGGISASKKPF